MENEVRYNVLDFILGGKSDFTIYQEPNIQVKYRVVANDTKTVWFIYTESDERKLTYQGYFTKAIPYSLKIGKKSVTSLNEKAVKGLMWVLNHANNLPDKVHILHHGHCSMCGRQLTDAESLASGLGPICRRKVRV